MPFSDADSVDHPISLYAATKKSNELMAYTYNHLYSLPTTGLRFLPSMSPEVSLIWLRSSLQKRHSKANRLTFTTIAIWEAISITSTILSREWFASVIEFFNQTRAGPQSIHLRDQERHLNKFTTLETIAR